MFAILRIAKLEKRGNLSSSLSHLYRERPTHNANSDLTPSNELIISQSVSEAMQRYDDRRATVTKTIRKDAVTAIEYFIGASPEVFHEDHIGDGSGYFTDAIEWLKQKHGEENIVSLAIHRDETSPHLTAVVIPITPEGGFSAKHFVGGRHTLSRMQTDFAKTVGEKHGLERGIEGSTAEHTTIKQYYERVNRPPSPNVKTIQPKNKPPKAVEKKAGAFGKVIVDAKELDSFEEDVNVFIKEMNANLIEERLRSEALLAEIDLVKHNYKIQIDIRRELEEAEKEIKDLKDELEQKSPITLHEFTTAIALNKEENEIMNKAVKNKKLYFNNKNEFEYKELNYRSPIDFLICVFKHTVESALVKLTTLFNRERVVTTFLEREREGVERMLDTQIVLQKNAQKAELTTTKKLEPEHQIVEEKAEQKPTNFGPSFG